MADVDLDELEDKARRFQWIDMPAPVDGSALLAVITELRERRAAAGYLAAKSEQEAAIRAAKCTGWSEGYERAMNDRDSPTWTTDPDTTNPYYKPEESA